MGGNLGTGTRNTNGAKDRGTPTGPRNTNGIKDKVSAPFFYLLSILDGEELSRRGDGKRCSGIHQVGVKDVRAGEVGRAG